MILLIPVYFSTTRILATKIQLQYLYIAFQCFGRELGDINLICPSEGQLCLRYITPSDIVCPAHCSFGGLKWPVKLAAAATAAAASSSYQATGPLHSSLVISFILFGLHGAQNVASTGPAYVYIEPRSLCPLDQAHLHLLNSSK